MTAYLRSKLVPDRPTMASVHGRAEVERIAPTDPARALALAHAIPDAWYRAQALSWVAEHARESSVRSIAGQAIAAAYDCSDADNTLAVMSWPLRAAWSRGRQAYARAELDRVLRLAPEVEPLASRHIRPGLSVERLQCRRRCLRRTDLADDPQALQPGSSLARGKALSAHRTEVREQRQAGSAAPVIAAMPEGKAKAALARRFKLA
ncbi:hypothetical protein SAMN05443247_05272 [Bradyrhizobium erythrophlei]|nr:hypothetical protein SAMN05443247_05272 [Bradyrhizobium erythrophlei]